MLDDCSALNFLDDTNVTKEIENLRGLLKYPPPIAIKKICAQSKRIRDILGVEVSPRIQALIDEMRKEK